VSVPKKACDGVSGGRGPSTSQTDSRRESVCSAQDDKGLEVRITRVQGSG